MPFSDSIAGTFKLIREHLQSENFEEGQKRGWRISRDGAAIFANLLLHFVGDFGRIEIMDGEIRVYDVDDVLRIKLTTDDGTSFHTPSMDFYDPQGNLIVRIQGNDSGANGVIVFNDDSTSGLGLDSNGHSVTTWELPGPTQVSQMEFAKVTRGFKWSFIPDSDIFGFDWNAGSITIEHIGVAPNEIPRIFLESPDWQASGGPSSLSIEGSKNGSLRQIIADTEEFTITNSAGIPVAVLIVPTINAADLNLSDDISVLGDVLMPSLRDIQNFKSGGVVSGSTVYVAAGGGSTDCSVTIPRPPSGRIRVDIATRGSNSLGVGNSAYTSYDIQENDSAGNFIRAAQDVDIEHQANGNRFGIANTHSGLPNVPNIFVRMMHRVNAGTGTWTNRRLIVTPVP